MRGKLRLTHLHLPQRGNYIHYQWITLFILILSIMAKTVVRAQIQTNTSHNYIYGQNATFILAIDDISSYGNFKIYISALNMNAVSVSVSPVNNRIVYERNLREQPLPPFSQVTYWWEYTDNDKLIATEKTSFRYIDNRFEWQIYTDKNIQLAWVNGDKLTYINATKIARDAINKIQYALQVQTATASTIEVYFYPSMLDMQSALQLAGYEWASGAAYPELGVILLSVPDGNQALSHIQRKLPHELTHKVLFDAYGAEGYKNIPAWLEEGLASYFESTPDPTYALVLAEANTTNTLIHFESLCLPFPDDQRKALLSYAQSESLTRYILQKFGWSSIRSLLHIYADEGVECTTGIEDVLDIQTLQFERDWRIWLETQSIQSPGDSPGNIFQLTPEIKATISIFIKDVARWLVLCAFVGIPFLFFFLQFVIKKHHPS
jgi:hypothetical protein